MYHAELGRFMTRDPLPQSGQPDVLSDNNEFGRWLDLMKNLYGYVGDNPINQTDPSGLGNGWSDAGEAIWNAAGYIVTGSEIPTAALALPAAAKILIINKFTKACKECLMLPPKSDPLCKVCSENERVKEKLVRTGCD